MARACVKLLEPFVRAMPQTLAAPTPPSEWQDTLQGEVIDSRIADIEALARWFDYAFVLPGGFRFGFAGIIGLLPGFGDLIDAIVSVYIVHRAIRLGIPRVTVARMVLNVGIEGLLGATPFIGDLFDIVFKANRRNYLLLRSHMTQSRRQQTMDWGFLLVTALLVIVSIALPVWGVIEILQHFL